VAGSRRVIESKSSGNRTLSGVVRLSFELCSEGLSTGRPAAGLLLKDHRIKNLLDDLFGLRVEARDSLELELERGIRPALILVEK
jgi:hypothetical protein